MTAPTPKHVSDDLQNRRVISEAEAAQLAGLSQVHFRRLRKERRGPPYVQLGERRIGYRVRDVLAWIDARLIEAI